jgi:dolichol-phosphate mannosyltransferase
MPKSDLFISVIVPLGSEEAGDAGSQGALAELQALLEREYENFEIVLVDDCLPRDAAAAADAALSRLRGARLVSLSRPMGLEVAIQAGLETAIGDFMVTLQVDRDPIAEIPRFVLKAREGYDLVVGVTRAEDDAALSRWMSRTFYALADRLLPTRILRGTTAFRVLSRQAVNALERVRSRDREFAVMAGNIGYAVAQVEYQQRPYRARAAERKLSARLRRGTRVLVQNSSLLLRLVGVMGLIGSALAGCYALYVVVVNLMLARVMPGWTTLSLVISGLFFLLFLMAAILGEYLRRILDEIGERPLFFVKGERVSPALVRDAERRNVLDEPVQR